MIPILPAKRNISITFPHRSHISPPVKSTTPHNTCPKPTYLVHPVNDLSLTISTYCFLPVECAISHRSRNGEKMQTCNTVREICPILSTWSRTATVQDMRQCEYVYDHVFWLRHEHYQERYVGIRDQGYELYFDRQKLRLVNPTPRSIWALDR